MLSRWNRLSITYKLVVAISAIVAITVSGLTAFYFRLEQQHSQTAWTSRASLLLDSFALASKSSLVSQDFAALDKIADQVSEQESVVTAKIYNNLGETVATSSQYQPVKYSSSSWMNSIQEQIIWEQKPQTVVISKAIGNNQSQLLGVVSLELSTKALAIAGSSLHGEYIEGAGIAILFGMSFIGIVMFTFHRSLQNLLKTANKLAKADLSEPMSFKTKDELETLANCLESVSDRWTRFNREWQHKTEALRQSEAKHSAILNSIPDLLLMLDFQGKILDAKIPPQKQSLFEDVIGCHLSELFSVTTAASFHASIRRAFIEKETQTLEYEWHLKNHRCFFEARIIVCGSSRVLAILRDNTQQKIALEELKQLKQAAEKTNLTKEKFLANMSHELRTPLNGILGLSDLLLAEAQDSGYTNIVGDLQLIQSSGTHLLTIIEDILDVSEQEEKVTLNPEQFDLDALVSEAITLVHPLNSKNDNQIVWQEGKPLGLMCSDRKRVKQVLFHLLSNAAKFTREGEIKLSIQRQPRTFLPALIDSRQVPIVSESHCNGSVPAFSDRPVATTNYLDSDWIVFEISDTGIGMSQQQIAQAFEPFQQGELGTTKKYPGIGLGLTICKSSCEMLGGNIKVVSTPNEGSTFTFWLPATLVVAA